MELDMERKWAVLGALMLLPLAGNAIAADLPNMKAPPVMPVLSNAYSWTGVYVGVQAGYGWGRDTTKEYFTNPWVYTGLANAYKATGFMGGGHVGANWQYGALVVGAEADVNFGSIKGGFVDPPAAPFNPGGYGKTRLQSEATFRGRIGYAFDRFLVYGTGGYAVGQLTAKYTNWGLVSEKIEKTIDGYTFGGGIEYALTDNVTVRGEYRHTEYNLRRLDSKVAFPGFTATQKPRFDSLRVGASYKF
jgi:outer membrane immunogenic protein